MASGRRTGEAPGWCLDPAGGLLLVWRSQRRVLATVVSVALLYPSADGRRWPSPRQSGPPFAGAVRRVGADQPGAEPTKPPGGREVPQSPGHTAGACRGLSWLQRQRSIGRPGRRDGRRRPVRRLRDAIGSWSCLLQPPAGPGGGGSPRLQDRVHGADKLAVVSGDGSVRRQSDSECPERHAGPLTGSRWPMWTTNARRHLEPSRRPRFIAFVGPGRARVAPGGQGSAIPV